MTINTTLLPEILIASLACFILLWDVFIPKKYRITTYILTQLGLIGVIYSICYNFKLDCQINFFKLIICSFILIIFMHAKNYLKNKNYFCGEYFVLSLFSVFGMMILIASNHFLNFYLGIEIFSIPIYALIALESKESNLEAAVKYFVISAIFSGILLYGISLVYGASGNLNFQEINHFIHSQHITVLFKLGIILVLISLFFKLSLVPVHMWAPDVYQGASTPVTMFIATLPKIAIIVVFNKIFKQVFPGLFDNFWQILLISIALLSLFIGNVGALLQTNIKRLIAYSAIGHAGFILLGLIINVPAGRLAANFYVVVYSLTLIGWFGIIILFSKNNFELEEIKDLSGIAKKYPWLSGILLILLLSMIGVPPTIGFYAKFLIIKSLIEYNLIWIAIIAVLCSVIGLFYYLRIIKAIYFSEFEYHQELNYKTSLAMPLTEKVISSVNGFLVIVLGILPIFWENMLQYLD